MNKNDEKVRVSKGTLKTAKRLLRYVTSRYKVQFFAVFICSLRCDFILHLYKTDGNDRSGCLKAGSG